MPYIPDVIPSEERARFVKGNMGARAGFGARPAVLVVDMTRAFVEDRFPLGSSKAAGVNTGARSRRLLRVRASRICSSGSSRARPRSGMTPPTAAIS